MSRPRNVLRPCNTLGYNCKGHNTLRAIDKFIWLIYSKYRKEPIMNEEVKRKVIAHHEDRASFMKRFRLKITKIDSERLDYAYEMAKYGHRNQFRESGERYFEHLRATAIILIDEIGVSDVEMIIAALLHDTLEDSFLLTPDRIKITFGERVATLVAAVSKPRRNDPRFKSKQERHGFYFAQLKDSCVEAKIIKLADRLQNTRTLDACSAEKQSRKTKETVDVYLPLIQDVIEEYPDKGQYFKYQFETLLSKTSECFTQKPVIGG